MTVREKMVLFVNAQMTYSAFKEYVEESDGNKIKYMKIMKDENEMLDIYRFIAPSVLEKRKTIKYLFDLYHECLDCFIMTHNPEGLVYKLMEVVSDPIKDILDYTLIKHLSLFKMSRYDLMGITEIKNELPFCLADDIKPDREAYLNLIRRVSGLIDGCDWREWLIGSKDKPMSDMDLDKNPGYACKLDLLICLYVSKKDKDLLFNHINNDFCEELPNGLLPDLVCLSLMMMLIIERDSIKETVLVNDIIKEILLRLDALPNYIKSMETSGAIGKYVDKYKGHIDELPKRLHILRMVDEQNINMLFEHLELEQLKFLFLNFAQFLPLIVHKHFETHLDEMRVLLDQILSMDLELYGIDSPSERKQIKILTMDSLYQCVHAGEHFDHTKCIEILRIRYANGLFFSKKDQTMVEQYNGELIENINHVIMTMKSNQGHELEGSADIEVSMESLDSLLGSKNELTTICDALSSSNRISGLFSGSSGAGSSSPANDI